MIETINKHEKIALQFSGGKDSLACLYLLREFWNRLTVYWLNTGDAYPETINLVGNIRAIVPHFVEIDGRQPAVIAAHGIPSDIVPVSGTPLGVLVAGYGQLIQDRYSCCFRSIMQPMHEKMIEDGITLIIRGQRRDDRLKAPIASGTVESGIEYLFPIEDWSQSQVMRFLSYVGAPVPRFYEMLVEAPDCMTCSAWWEKGEAKYLKRYHVDAYVEVQRRLDIINEAVSAHIANFNEEVL